MDKFKQKIFNKEPVVIVGFGDSLTQGWMVRKGYLDFLSEMIAEAYPDGNCTIINRGIPGDTAEGGLYRVSSDVNDEDPDLVLVQFALNDAYMGVSKNSFGNSIRQIINSIRENTSAEILLLTSVHVIYPLESKTAEEFYAVLENISNEENLPLAKVHEHWKEAIKKGKDHRLLVQGDGVHPTVEGYRLMAEAVFEFFV